MGRPRIYSPFADPELVTVCSLCLTFWGPGQDHICSKQTRMNNVEELVRTTSKRSREKVISSQLKEVFKEQGVSIHSGTASLTTGGTPNTATIRKKKLKPALKFTNEYLNRLQLKTGNSDN